MTANVLVSVPIDDDRTTQGTQQTTNGTSTVVRQHVGRHDCGCGRTGCHAEFVALAAATDAQARTAARNRQIEAHLDLAYRIAGRYRRPGPGFDDIRQVAALALLEAVNRFEPSLGTAFSAFAVPTITGAIKRHFRDQRWTIHPPRRIKELRLRIRAATDVLAQQMRDAPTVTDLADYLECAQEDICEALCTDDALRPLSLDAPVGALDQDTTLAATVGCLDDGYARVEDRETLRPLLAELPERELQVIIMRFFGNLTQSQIAERVGCSQMHVSRILRAALARLRHGLENGDKRADRQDACRQTANAPVDEADLATRTDSERPVQPGPTPRTDEAGNPSGTSTRDTRSRPEHIPTEATGPDLRFRTERVPAGRRPHPTKPPRNRPPNRPVGVSTVLGTAAWPPYPAGRWPSSRRPYRRRRQPPRSPPTGRRTRRHSRRMSPAGFGYARTGNRPPRETQYAVP